MSPLYYFQFIVFSVCINLFTVFTYFIYYSDLFSLTFRNELQREYDYVIVGSGTAGSVIAHRIATETNYTFIVIEAGSKSNPLLDIPVVGPLLHGSLYDWHYETVPQDNACFAVTNNKCKLPRGKVLGGSSKLNNMIHVRGNISHYLNWFHGKYTEEYIRKQFEFVENNIIHLDDVRYESHLTNAILDAAKELGYENLQKSGQGFVRIKVSQKNGKRWSTSDNLDPKHIITNTLVQNVLIKNNIAYGVCYDLLGKKNKVFARKGVILSAGTYNSPKILQLSGIGPTKLLKSLGIPVVKELPVGKNLQDHITTGLDLVLFNKSLSISAKDILNPIHMFQYFFYGTGPLTSPGCEVIGFLSTKNETTPDLQFMVLPVGISADRGSHLRHSLGIKDEVWYNYFVTTFEKHTASILPIVLHPKSKGEVFINSIDPKYPPSIDPKLLASKEDREMLIKGLKIVSKLVGTDSMKAFGAHLNPMSFPGCENYTIFSDTYWDCYIKYFTSTTYHPVGTCSMGLPELKNTVVDTSFKVLGINRLFVADGSVLPTLPSGNINAAIAMMASVFFDSNIGSNLSVKVDKVCFGYNFVYDYIFKICLVIGNIP